MLGVLATLIGYLYRSSEVRALPEAPIETLLATLTGACDYPTSIQQKGRFTQLNLT